MAYGWRDPVRAEDGTAAYYDELDRRFFASSPFYAGDRPFERLIPYDRIDGADVLEVGCGLGSHAELFIRGGANYTGIDLTGEAIASTRRRLEVRGLEGRVEQMDAEQMTFEDASFDFVWSWGVIHHSSDPAAILDEMRRLLRPGGEVKLMVYHRRSIQAQANVIRGYATGKSLRDMDAGSMMSHYVDGFIARHYTQEGFASLLRDCGFTDISTCALGQSVEMLPVPGVGPLGPVKRAVSKMIPDRVTRSVLRRYGWFLLASARKPA